ncbi:MAG: SdiA-regulated domain-containing protein [Ignavibacteriaceae bacterium]|nr:SdiA-regulated domain-containing protein [Ignavibacteriaceae bacterium]
MNLQRSFFIVLSILLLSYCRDSSPNLSNSLLKKYNFDPDNITVIKLPQSLREISGLAFLKGNEVLTHNDEEGIIFIVDISLSKVVSDFVLDDDVEKDFEGIAVVKDSIYLVNSNGTIYKFRLQQENESADFVKFKTFLDSENNIEGFCYDASTNSLLLACKNDPGKGFKKLRAVYEFNLNKMILVKKPRFLISLDELRDKFNINGFEPSGIEKNPISGNFFMVSAHPEAILELSPEGKILAAYRLDEKEHKQTEGITFLQDGTMLISDEGQKKSARISIIRLKEKR